MSSELTPFEKHMYNRMRQEGPRDPYALPLFADSNLRLPRERVEEIATRQIERSKAADARWCASLLLRIVCC